MISVTWRLIRRLLSRRGGNTLPAAPRGSLAIVELPPTHAASSGQGFLFHSRGDVRECICARVHGERHPDVLRRARLPVRSRCITSVKPRIKTHLRADAGRRAGSRARRGEATRSRVIRITPCVMISGETKGAM